MFGVYIILFVVHFISITCDGFHPFILFKLFNLNSKLYTQGTHASLGGMNS